MLKKRWFFLAFIVCLIVFAASALNTTWLTVFVVRRVVEASPGVTLKRFYIDHQQFTLPGRLELFKVDLALEMNGKLFILQAPQMDITGLQSCLSAERHILVSARGMTARYDPGQVRQLSADLVIDGRGISGPLTAVDAAWDKFRARDLSLFLIADQKGVELRAVKFSAYEGRITGKFFMQAPSGPGANAYKAGFFIEGLDVARLAEVNPEVAVQLNGIVRGTLGFEGVADELQVIDADLNMPAGGRMSASLLGALMQYLPQSRERKRLDVLIRKGGKIGMENFMFVMKGGQNGKFEGRIQLKSREVNLELNLEHEINTDGTIASLMAYWSKFWK